MAERKKRAKGSKKTAGKENKKLSNVQGRLKQAGMGWLKEKACKKKRKTAGKVGKKQNSVQVRLKQAGNEKLNGKSVI